MSVKVEKSFWSSLIGFFTVSLMGIVGHFLYSLSGNNQFVGLFMPVNESVWEHLKLLFFPFMLYVFIELALYGRKISGFLFSRITGVIVGLVFIPTAYFIYTAVIGKNFAPLDILLYFIGVFISFNISYKRILHGHDKNIFRTISAIVLFVGISALFIGLTFSPPNTALFNSPMR